MSAVFVIAVTSISMAEADWIRIKLDNVIPLESSQDIQAIGVGIGKETTDMGEVEMNVSLSPNQIFDRKESIPMAWSGSVTNRQVMSISPVMDAFISFRAGFVAGDRSETDVDNLYYPFLQLGLGMQVYHRFSRKSYMALMPEFGVIPGMPYSGDLLSIAAATVAVSVAFGKNSTKMQP